MKKKILFSTLLFAGLFFAGCEVFAAPHGHSGPHGHSHRPPVHRGHMHRVPIYHGHHHPVRYYRHYPSYHNFYHPLGFGFSTGRYCCPYHYPYGNFGASFHITL